MPVTFTRFAETIHCKEDKRVVSVTVKLLLGDCTGTVYFTDIQAQEGDRLTGYTINTETMLQKFREGGVIVPARFYNGVVRSGETVILFNLGSTSTGLDCHIYPIQNMAAGSIQLSQGAGAHKDGSIATYQTLPWNHRGWHAGGKANDTHTMMNKLIFGQKFILRPLFHGLRNQNNAASFRRIEELETKIENNMEQSQVLTGLPIRTGIPSTSSPDS